MMFLYIEISTAVELRRKRRWWLNQHSPFFFFFFLLRRTSIALFWTTSIVLFAKAQSELRRHILLLLVSNELEHWRLRHWSTFLSRRSPSFHNHRCVALFAYPSFPPCSYQHRSIERAIYRIQAPIVVFWRPYCSEIFASSLELHSSSFSVLRIRALAVSSWTLCCCLPFRLCAAAFISTWQQRCTLNTHLKLQCPHADKWLPCGLEFQHHA